MGYRVRGTLKLPDGTPGTNCEIEFTSRKNFTPVLTGMGASIRTDSAGAYDVTLEYGAYAVILRTGNTYPTAIGQFIVASDTVVGQDLPTLLEKSGWQPATPEYIQQITKWLEEANASATRATASASAAKVSETNSKASEIAAEADRSEVAVNTADVRVKHSDVVAKSAQVSIDSSATQDAKSTAVSAADTATQKALAAAESEASAFSSATRSEASAVKSAADGAAQAELAKSQADRAKSEADRASKISGLETVADAIGIAALPLPDVWAPLSDSLRMITGYGREVKVGDDVVAQMVNFSRSTTATYIGKDGLLKTAAANEPRFEKAGLLIEGQSTNLVVYSEGATFFTANASFQTLTNNVSGVLPMTGQRISFAVNNGETNANLIQTPLTLIGGQTYTYSTHLKVEAGDTTAPENCIGIYAADGVNIGARAVIRKTGGGIYRVSVPFTVSGTGSQTVFIQFNRIGTPSAVWTAVVGGVQVENLPFASSYIPTNGAAATRVADRAYILWENNMPLSVANAVSFAVEATPYKVTTPDSRTILDLGVSSASLSIGDFNTVAYITINDKFATINRDPNEVTSRLVARYDGSFLTVGNNGVIGTTTAYTADGDRPSTRYMRIGTWASGNTGWETVQYGTYRCIWGHIRNIRIWHSDLTNEQMRAIR